MLNYSLLKQRFLLLLMSFVLWLGFFAQPLVSAWLGLMMPKFGSGVTIFICEMLTVVNIWADMFLYRRIRKILKIKPELMLSPMSTIVLFSVPLITSLLVYTSYMTDVDKQIWLTFSLVLCFGVALAIHNQCVTTIVCDQNACEAINS